MPALILAQEGQISAEDQQALQSIIDQEKTGLFDTHPATKDRILNIQREEIAGVMSYEGQAQLLFADFEALCQEVSLALYQQVFQQPIQPGQLHCVEELVSRQEQLLEEIKAQRRYFQGIISTNRPLQLTLPSVLSQLSREEAKEILVAAREQLLARLDAHQATLKQADRQQERLYEVAYAEALLGANYKINAADFHLDDASSPGAETARLAAQQELSLLDPELAPLERLTSERVLVALQALALPEVAAQLEGAEALMAEGQSYLSLCRLMNDIQGQLDKIGERWRELMALVQQLQHNNEHEGLYPALSAAMEATRLELVRLPELLGQAPYPFDHGQENITLAAHLVFEPPLLDDLSSIIRGGQEAMERGGILYLHLLGRLAQIAEQVEQALDLPPLPEPPEEEETD